MLEELKQEAVAATLIVTVLVVVAVKAAMRLQKKVAVAHLKNAVQYFAAEEVPITLVYL